MPLQQFSHLSPSPSPQLLPIISLLITAKQDIRKWIVLPKAYQLGNTTTATLYRSKSATLYSTREKSLPSTVEKKKTPRGKKPGDCEKICGTTGTCKFKKICWL